MCMGTKIDCGCLRTFWDQQIRWHTFKARVHECGAHKQDGDVSSVGRSTTVATFLRYETQTSNAEKKNSDEIYSVWRI